MTAREKAFGHLTKPICLRASNYLDVCLKKLETRGRPNASWQHAGFAKQSSAVLGLRALARHLFSCAITAGNRMSRVKRTRPGEFSSNGIRRMSIQAQST